MINHRKVGIIGCGFVGSAIAFAIMGGGLFSEMVLIDIDKNKAEGEAMDIADGLPFNKPMKIYAGDYDDLKDAFIIIITAGASQRDGETRLELVDRNILIYQSIIPLITKINMEAILLIVTNPVDALTYAAYKLSGYPKERVIGSGTVLDTARLKLSIGEYLEVDSRGVHAFIIGEHGDSEIVAWSSANISGVELTRFCEMRGHSSHDETMEKIANDVKMSAYEIIKRKKATYYGIAMSVKRICEAITRDEKSILPVSSIVEGLYDMNNICLSIPTIVGCNGVEGNVPISLNQEEKMKLLESYETLKEINQKFF